MQCTVPTSDVGMNLRKDAPELWLVGRPIPEILGSKLPSNREALQLVSYLRGTPGLETYRQVRESSYRAIEEILKFWQCARIPTQRKDHAVEHLEELHELYVSLKKNKHRSNEDCEKNGSFRGKFRQLIRHRP